MLPELRAVVFDLDDTLYPYAWFRASGFSAVADYLHRTYDCDAREALRELLQAARSEQRGRELQACLAAQRLPADLIDEILNVFRDHVPELNLPGPSRVALRVLRREGWRLGVLTNGDPAIQRRKVAALGLRDLVDTIVYAREVGDRTGKPDTAAFLEVAHQLRVPGPDVVFVGNDERCDVEGALTAGMHAILCTAWTEETAVTAAHRVATRLGDVPEIAAALVGGASKSHAA